MYELINNVPLKIKEYKGQRVVTFRDIDTVHDRPEGTARKRFNDNRKRFIDGEDFFILKLTTSEIRTQFGAGKNAGKMMILLTETGYLMLVKSFTDDLAWTVQRQFVKAYFRVREPEKQPSLADIDAIIEKAVCRVLDEKLKAVAEPLERKIDMLEKNSCDRTENIVKSIKEAVFETSVGTAQVIMPCFVHIYGKLRKISKKLKK